MKSLFSSRTVVGRNNCRCEILLIAAVVALLIALMLRMSSFFIPLSKHFFKRHAEQCRRVENVISHELVNRHVNVSYAKVTPFE